MLEKQNNTRAKTVFITGGAAGIGLATARRLLRENFNIVIYSLGTEDPIFSDFDASRSLIIEGDVRDRSQVSSAMNQAREKFGSLDILINNAAVARREEFIETSEADWDWPISVNLKGAMICIQEFIKARNGLSSPGLVINISSGAGIYGRHEIAVYSMTKAGLINLTQSLSREITPTTGVEFVTVCPGASGTAMFRGLFPEKEPYQTPEYIADVIYQTIIGEQKPDDRLIVDVFRHLE